MLNQMQSLYVTFQSKSVLLFSVSILLAFILGCGLSGSSKTCVGVLTHQGQTFRGEGKDEKDAKLFACNGYCLEADPDFDARYRIWLDSPKGERAGKPSKKEAIYKDKDLLDYVTITCANKCVKDAEAGKFKLEVNCK